MMRFWLLFVLLVAVAPSAYAMETMSEGTCTTDPQYTIPTEFLTGGGGLVTTVVEDIEGTMDSVGWSLYGAISTSDTIKEIIPAAITLYITIYGILFIFGMVQFTLFDLFVRLIKIGIIGGIVASSGNWGDYIYDTLTNFFGQGTDIIINQITASTFGDLTIVDPEHPFSVMDAALAKILSAKMLYTLLAMVITGPYGLIFAILLVLSLGSFLKALLTAMWVYLMALVLRSLMIAMAPIFLIFMLFERTRHLFTGWLSQLINTCLQPILLFVFFAFFATLLAYSVDAFLETPVCLTFTPELWRGGPTDPYFWRFMIRDGSGWVPFPGLWGVDGPEGIAGGKPFPIDLLTILIFYFLAELAGRFNDVVLMIARDLSGAGVDFSNMQSPLSDWFSPFPAGKTPSDNRKGPVGMPGGAGKASEALRSFSQGGLSGVLKEQLQRMGIVRDPIK